MTDRAHFPSVQFRFRSSPAPLVACDAMELGPQPQAQARALLDYGTVGGSWHKRGGGTISEGYKSGGAPMVKIKDFT